MPESNAPVQDNTEMTCPQCGSAAVLAATFILPGGDTEDGWVCEEEDCWANWRDEEDEDRA